MLASIILSARITLFKTKTGSYSGISKSTTISQAENERHNRGI